MTRFSFLEVNSVHEYFVNILPEAKKESLPHWPDDPNSVIHLENLQPVANPRLCDDIDWPGGVWFDLPAQIADVDLEHVGFAFVGGAPDGAQQLVVGKNLAGMFCQCAE